MNGMRLLSNLVVKGAAGGRGEVHPKPGVPTQVILLDDGFDGHSTRSRVFGSVPRSLVVGDAPIGRSTPRTMRPIMVATLMTVSQNSISPYRRTLKLLNRRGTIRKTVIQMDELY
jgi:hypothetical protein